MEILLRTVNFFALLLLPLMWWQGRGVRKRTPRLPAAAGPCHGVIGDHEHCLKLVFIGESPVAGVGVAEQSQAVAAQTAQVVHAALKCDGVAWHSAGRIGIRLYEAMGLLDNLAKRDADCIVLVFGVNDSTALTTAAAWYSDLSMLLSLLAEQFGAVPVVICAAPPLERFPALPQPTARLLGWRAALLNCVSQRLVNAWPQADYFEFSMPLNPEKFAGDGYHPSADGYRQWAEQLGKKLVSILQR